MGNVWTLFKNNLYILIVKKRSTFILGLLAPIAVLVLSSKLLNFSGSTLNIGIVDNDNSATSIALIGFLDDTGVIKSIKLEEDEALNSYIDRKVYGVVSFPKGFEEALINGEDGKITIKGGENDNVKELLSDIIYPEVVNIKNLAKASENRTDYIRLLDNYKNNAAIQIERKSLSDLKGDYMKSNVFVGFIIFFMLLRGCTGVVHYFDEKRENVFNRFFMAPLKSYQYYLADLLSNYLVIIIQAIIGIIGINLIKANIGVSNVMLFVIMSAVGLVSVSLAICLRAFCKNYSEFNMIFNFATMILIMVGGCFIPLEVMPKVVNSISYLTPTRWAMEAVVDLQLGLKFIDILPNLLIIILFAVVFFVVGAYKTTKSEKEFSL